MSRESAQRIAAETMRDIQWDAWRVIAKVSLFCAVVCGFAWCVLGCAGASGHARSGGTELGTTIIEPEIVKFKYESIGDPTAVPPTAEEVRQWIEAGLMKKPEKTSK